MLCPKCKKEIEDNSIRCPFCEAKVGSTCKKCGTYNTITSLECSFCHAPLLIICPQCGAANMPNSKQCRKCKINLKQEVIKTPISQKLEYQASFSSQQKVKKDLMEAIKDGNQRVITISGASGIGKNLVLRAAISELKTNNIIWMYGTCSQLTQLSPFGYFQDLLLTFFNINNFCPDTLQLKRNSIKFFKQDFPTLTNSEIVDLLNILYPENNANYIDIYKNKAKSFVIMKKIILTIVEKMKVVFVVDHYEFLDGMSLDFFKELLKDEFIISKCKFVLMMNEVKPGLGCFYSPMLDSENYVDLSIAPFTLNQVESLVNQYSVIDTRNNFAQYAMNISNGIPSIVEQIIMYQKDCIKRNINFNRFDSFSLIVEARLSLLKKHDLKAYKILIAMAILGTKFCPSILENFDLNSTKDFEAQIEKLSKLGYIVQLNNLSYEFKSFELWDNILKYVKNDEIFNEVLKNLYQLLITYKHSSVAVLSYMAENLQLKEEAFELWNLLAKQCAYIGDIGLFIVSQKQSLKHVEDCTTLENIAIKKEIYIKLGKLLEPIDAEAGFNYIQKAVGLLGKNETLEKIDLLGYLASCSMKKGNYCGVIECINTVLEQIPNNLDLEKVIVKSRLIHPYICLGNYGQAINLIDTEIMPIFEKHLSKGLNTSIIPINELFDLWIKVYFDFIEALTFQGNSRMFSVIKILFEIIEKNKINNKSILCKAHLALALANTIKGDTNTSKKILDDILKEYNLDEMEPFITSRWNFIDMLNKYFANDYDNIYSEMFDVVSFANNINDNFTKNILKTMFAQIVKDKSDIKKALEILDEQVAYFAKEKIATGVLLCWYMIAEMKLVTKGTQFALDIATKALDIAQSPNINNYYFMTLLNKLIGEIYIAKQDFESAKVYIEKAVFLAKQFFLDRILIDCFITYSKYYQELALPKSNSRIENIKQALKMLQKAKNIEIVAEHHYLQNKVKNELTVLTSFCKLNGIILKKNSKSA